MEKGQLKITWAAIEKGNVIELKILALLKRRDATASQVEKLKTALYNVRRAREYQLARIEELRNLYPAEYRAWLQEMQKIKNE
jgi:inorganic pyrophosphatase